MADKPHEIKVPKLLSDYHLKNLPLDINYDELDEIEKDFEEYKKWEEKWKKDLGQYNDNENNSSCTSDDIKCLLCRGLPENTLLGDLILGKIKSAKLEELPAGTIIKSNIPSEEIFTIANQDNGLSPSAKVNLINLPLPQGSRILLEVNSKIHSDPYNVEINDGQEMYALQLRKACAICCGAPRTVNANIAIGTEEVLGCLNSVHTQESWAKVQSILSDIQVSDIQCYEKYTEANVKDHNPDNVIAYVLI